MTEPIILPILFRNQATSTKENLGVDYKMSDNSVREIPFYNINVLCPYFDGETEYCTVFSGGHQFISTMTMEYIMDLIEQASMDEQISIAEDMFNAQQN